MSPREDNLTKANRISDWGNSLLNKLPAVTRRRRKRLAGKKRRNIEKHDAYCRSQEQSQIKGQP